MLTAEQIERAKAEAAEKRAFDAFMTRPTTRLPVSMIPAAENADTLTTLLHEAFNVGFGTGVGYTMANIMERVLRDPVKGGS